MQEYIDLKVDFAMRNAKLSGVTLENVVVRSYDTAIKFRIEIADHVLDDTYDVKILSKYSASNLKVMNTLRNGLEIADGKIIYTPKVNLITEADYVRNFLYLSKDGFGLDMAQFNYEVDVSHIGDVAVEVRQVYDESYETLITEFEQALEDYKLTLPQADSVRAEIDVILNQFGVDSQTAIGDLNDVSAAVEVAEASRVEKESERIQAETERKEAETLREENYEQLIDTAIIEVDIVEKVDNKVTELTPQINQLTAQLAQTKSAVDSVEKANSKVILGVKNYLGNYNNTHPKVLHFENGWNGFKYWMGYTPYPAGATAAENPCIAVSNDMVNWTVPVGLTNPLDAGHNDDYNSDTHLVYRADKNWMEIWWRQRRSSDGHWLIYRRTSTNGVNWTPKELIMDNTTETDTMSPAIIFEDGRYKMWFKNGPFINYVESTGDTISSWGSYVKLNIDFAYQNIDPWHIDVIKSELGYEFLLCARSPAGQSRTSLFHFIQSNDGQISKPELVIAPSTNPTAIDSFGIYRSTFIKVKGVYYVFYAPTQQDINGNLTEFYLALSMGKSMRGLNGYIEPAGSPKVLTIDTIGDVKISTSDANYYDAIRIMGDGLTRITIIRGNQIGSKLTIFLGSTANSNKCEIIYSDPYLLTPNNQPYILSRESGTTSVDLVCYSSTWRYRVVGTNENYQRGIYRALAGEILTNFDVTNYDAIEIVGGDVVINSFSGGYLGKVIYIYCTNAGATPQATFVASGRIKVPNGTDFILNREKMGVTAIRQPAVQSDWVVF